MCRGRRGGGAASPANFVGPARVVGRFRKRGSLVSAGGLLIAAVTACSQPDVYFCPDEPCSEVLIAEMNAASTSLHVAIAYFNHVGIADAIIAAHARGVEVRVIGEARENAEGGINYDRVQELLAADVDYRDDGNSALMHDKFSIIDGHIVLTGSFNYTTDADENHNENLLLIRSARLGAEYEVEFENLWEDAAP